VNPVPTDGWKVVEKASELARQGAEFALATVVWRQGPSSGHQGARAIITADGEIIGWIGGACAEPVVIREAQRAIADRAPRLILLGAREQFGEVPEGMLFVPMSCQSEGAMELYIEPVLPSPHLVVVGRSPMAATLVELAGAVGWRADLVDAAHLNPAHIDSTSVVVVATQGHGDEEAIELAVKQRPAFVGLVASKKRGDVVLGYLADRGVPREQLGQVRVPVGLDLGHTTHPEIAVAVLAELVELRAKGLLNPQPAAVQAETAQPTTAVDLVCGMTVPADSTSRPFEYEGEIYYFCSPGCRVAFETDPVAYISHGATK
jgi:xanthine dehydrogenase accessory factor